jgi:hypothetical protein
LLPAALLFIAYLVAIAGYPWNVHGDFILLFLVVLGMSAVALIFEIAALVKTVRLMRAGLKPSAIDVICITYGCVFALGAGGLLVMFLRRQF